MKVLKGEVKVEFKEIVMTKSLEVEDELYNALRELRQGVKRISKDAPSYIKESKEKAKTIRDKTKKSLESIVSATFNK
ncbi:hypothetical protein ACTPEF_26310, partial [Clostridioides difficile]